MNNPNIKTPQGFWQAILRLTEMIRQGTLTRSARHGGVYRYVSVTASGDTIQLLATDTFSLGRVFIPTDGADEFLASVGMPPLGDTPDGLGISGLDVWEAKTVINSKKAVPVFSVGENNMVHAVAGEKSAEIAVENLGRDGVGVFPNTDKICLTTNKGVIAKGSAQMKSASLQTAKLAEAVAEVASVPNTKAEISKENRDGFLAANGHLKFSSFDIHTTDPDRFGDVTKVGKLLQNCPEDLFMVFSTQKLHNNLGVFSLCEKGHFYAVSEKKPFHFIGKTDDVLVEVAQMPLREGAAHEKAREHMVA